MHTTAVKSGRHSPGGGQGRPSSWSRTAVWAVIVAAVAVVLAAAMSQLVHGATAKRAVWIGVLVLVAVGEGLRRAAAEAVTARRPADDHSPRGDHAVRPRP